MPLSEKTTHAKLVLKAKYLWQLWKQLHARACTVVKLNPAQEFLSVGAM